MEIVTKAETEESTGKDLETMADAKTSEGTAGEAETEAGLQEEKSKVVSGNREEDAKKAGGTVQRTEADGTSDSGGAAGHREMNEPVHTVRNGRRFSVLRSHFSAGSGFFYR